MKRYIIKAGFNSKSELEKAQNYLDKVGVTKKDIDYIANPPKEGFGLKLERETKASLLSIRFFIFGLCLGFIFYFISLFRNSNLSFLESLQALDLRNLLLTTLVTGTVSLIIGYIIGRRYSFHVVKFDKSNKKEENILMSVNTDDQLLNKTKEVLEKVEVTTLDIIDSKQEVEVGLRVN